MCDILVTGAFPPLKAVKGDMSHCFGLGQCWIFIRLSIYALTEFLMALLIEISVMFY